MVDYDLGRTNYDVAIDHLNGIGVLLDQFALLAGNVKTFALISSGTQFTWPSGLILGNQTANFFNGIDILVTRWTNNNSSATNERPANMIRSILIQHYTKLRLRIEHTHAEFASPTTNDLDDFDSDYLSSYSGAVTSLTALETDINNLRLKHQNLFDTLRRAMSVYDYYKDVHPYSGDLSLLDPFVTQLLFDYSDVTVDATYGTGAIGVAHWLRKNIVYDLRQLKTIVTTLA